MIKTLTTAATTLTLLASTALAATHQVQATVTDVFPMTSRITEMVPNTVCDTVQVPITETRRQGGGGGDALAGMIIGGLIGKGATGNDKGAAVGAVIGGMMASEGNSYQVVTGYRNEQQCRQEYTTQFLDVNSGYQVEYNWNGLEGTVMTNTQYRVGDTILINITMN